MIKDDRLVEIVDRLKPLIAADHFCIVVVGLKTNPPSQVAAVGVGIKGDGYPDALRIVAQILEENETHRFHRQDRP